ncbi:PIN domain protein [Candidatus Desulfarcum epimagneticum]|uniref:PIN domain protein n=1 Tax=uncultured Desulfobacteraceae bacterium TaxID=218296 RepID=A0A484HHF9_9BACT|nr:PIN domain protein [uncultured Desulfobacteraceae bacterium]
MLNLFFDTSALAKIFHKEAGSEAVIGLIQNQNAELWISELARVELVSALHRRFRMHEINAEQLKTVLGILGKELKNFHSEPLGSGVLAEAEKLIRDYAGTIGLRTLDALHLATFLLISETDWKFVVADNALLKAAAQLNIQIFNPLKNEDQG